MREGFAKWVLDHDAARPAPVPRTAAFAPDSGRADASRTHLCSAGGILRHSLSRHSRVFRGIVVTWVWHRQCNPASDGDSDESPCLVPGLGGLLVRLGRAMIVMWTCARKLIASVLGLLAFVCLAFVSRADKPERDRDTFSSPPRSTAPETTSQQGAHPQSSSSPGPSTWTLLGTGAGAAYAGAPFGAVILWAPAPCAHLGVAYWGSHEADDGHGSVDISYHGLDARFELHSLPASPVDPWLGFAVGRVWRLGSQHGAAGQTGPTYSHDEFDGRLAAGVDVRIMLDSVNLILGPNVAVGTPEMVQAGLRLGVGLH